MNGFNQQNTAVPSEENVLFGVIGAFLFSLVGGVLYIILGMIGYIAALSGLVGVVCAIKGYSFFAKKESKKGIIISVIIAAIVLIIAWYVSFCLDMVQAYAMWFEQGEVDYAPTIFEYLPFGFYDLTVNPLYFVDLALSLGLGAVGCWSYISNVLKRQKALAATAQNAVETTADPVAQPAAEEESPAEDTEDQNQTPQA